MILRISYHQQQQCSAVKFRSLYQPRVLTLFLFFILFSGAVCGQQTADVASAPLLNSTNRSQAEVQRNENYLIGPGDVLDIFVTKNDTLSRQGVRVSNQGFIQLSMIESDIPAACRTEGELAEQIKGQYKKYLLNPQVIVTVKEFNSSPVSLIGAVIMPTKLQMQRPVRLLEMLTLGNGPSPAAGKTVQIIRNSNFAGCERISTGASTALVTAEPGEDLITFDLSETLKGSDEANPYLKPGDIVRVVEAEKVEIKQAYIIGNVKAAKAVDLKDSVTLTQAIAMAGGTSEGAQIDKIKISRRVPGTLNKTDIIANLKDINKHTANDILLEPNDIIDVPGPSAGKKFLKDIFKTIIPSVTRLPLGF